MAWLRNRLRRTPRIPHSARRPLAIFCLVLGVAGCILPIIPGLPFLVLTGRLLGPRDPLLRKSIVASRRGLRRLRGARQPLLRRAGAQLAPHLHTFTRMMIGSRSS